VTFVSSNPAVASVDATGLSLRLRTGLRTITGRLKVRRRFKFLFTVKSLVSIAVSPTSIALTAVGQVQPLCSQLAYSPMVHNKS